MSHDVGMLEFYEARIAELEKELEESKKTAKHWEDTYHDQWKNYQENIIPKLKSENELLKQIEANLCELHNVALAECARLKSENGIEFSNAGLMAAAFLVRIHDAPTQAASVLVAMGLDRADCRDLDAYEKEALRKLQDDQPDRLNLLGLDA